MTSASNQQITRCPKCGTAFRITQTQLQSAKGSVRCGSCLNVFKAVDYLVASTAPKPSESPKAIAASKPVEIQKSVEPLKPTVRPTLKQEPEKVAAPRPSIQPFSAEPPNKQPVVTKPAIPVAEKKKEEAQAKKPEQLAILSSIKPLPITPPAPAVSAKPVPKPASQKPVVRVLNKSSLENVDDILISDDMEETKADVKNYEFDGFMEIDTAPKTEVSLFERKFQDQNEKDDVPTADESWAEMLIEDEDDTPKYSARREPIVSDDEINEFHNTTASENQQGAIREEKSNQISPGLMFSLVGDPDETTPTKALSGSTPDKADDEFILSEELDNIPDHTGFKHAAPVVNDNPLDPNIFETTDSSAAEASSRQVKTQPKIRAYDGSRAALLMNIIPAPIEFNAKRMRRWYQRKLWPTLSLLALIALVAQLGWFKFDYFSRVEPYRTAYTFLCPYLGCQVPTLVDTRQISAFNLVVREHPDSVSALAVDVMIMNNAPFDQPYPDLVLMFTDLDENEVASRRFSPKEYLGGEAAGSSHMPQKQPVHLTLDLVDPGEKAVNYHIYIPRQ